MRVNRFLERLAQQILAAFRRADVTIGTEHDVVRGERIGGDEEAQVALDDQTLVVGQAVRVLPTARCRAACSLPAASSGSHSRRDTFSHAHLYLNGTSWLTSACALITRLFLDLDACEALRVLRHAFAPQ